MSGRLKDDGGILDGAAGWVRRLAATGLLVVPDAAGLTGGFPFTLTAYTGSGYLVAIEINPGWLTLQTGVPAPSPPPPWLMEALRPFEVAGFGLVLYSGPDLDGVHGNVAILQWRDPGVPPSADGFTGSAVTVAVTLLFEPPPPAV